MRLAEEEQKKQEAEFTQRECEVIEECQRQVEAKRRVEAEKKAEAEKRMEMEDKGKKWGREESVNVTVGSMLEDRGVMWYLKEGQVCEGCAKSGEKCFLRDSPWATACRHCHINKKTCMVGAEKEGSEAGPLKKRKVAVKGKGKEKEKERSGLELGADARVVLLGEMRGMREEIGGMRESVEGLRTEFHMLASIGKAIVKLLQNTNENVGFITDQMDTGNDAESGDGEAEGVVGVEGNIRAERVENKVKGTLQ